MKKDFDDFCKDVWNEIECITKKAELCKDAAYELLDYIRNRDNLNLKIKEIVTKSLEKNNSLDIEHILALSKRIDVKKQNVADKDVIHVSQFLDRPDYALRIIDDVFSRVCVDIKWFQQKINEKCKCLLELESAVKESRIKMSEKFFTYTGKHWILHSFKVPYYPLDVYFMNVKNYLVKDYPDVDFNDVDPIQLSYMVTQDANVAMDVSGIKHYFKNWPVGTQASCKYESYEKFYNFMKNLFEVNQICSDDEIESISKLGNMFIADESENRRKMINSLICEYSKNWVKCGVIKDEVCFITRGMYDNFPVDNNASEKLKDYFKKVA